MVYYKFYFCIEGVLRYRILINNQIGIRYESLCKAKQKKKEEEKLQQEKLFLFNFYIEEEEGKKNKKQKWKIQLRLWKKYIKQQKKW